MDKLFALMFPGEFIEFLGKWQAHLPWIAVSFCIWIAIVVHLVATKHAQLGSNGTSGDIGCPDIRVWKIFGLFAGSAGLSYGLPHFWLMNYLHLSGWVQDYWSGFVYMQFATSAIQTVVLIVYALFGPTEKWWRFLKAHLKGCGWISSLSPVGWVAYLFQQFLPNDAKILMWAPRDAETIFVFVFSLILSPLVAICVLASLIGSISHLGLNIVIPTIGWIDEDHVAD